MNKGIEICNRLRRFNERLDRGDTIKAHRVDGPTTFTKRKGKTMARKKKKTPKAKTAKTTTETDAYKERLATRLARVGNGEALAVIDWMGLFAMIMQMIEACKTTSASKIVARTQRPGLFLQIRMARRIRKTRRRGSMSFGDAADISDAIIDEANANPKGMERFINEVRSQPSD